MTDREAMKQALEALTVAWQQNPRWQITDSMHALRARLSQPKQKPVQYKCTVIDDAHPNGVPLEQWGKQPEQEPPQRTWVGLTDEEREELMDTYDVASTDYAKAIEAKLKEKNA